MSDDHDHDDHDDDDNIGNQRDDYDDEVGAEGNLIIGGRAKAVVEHVTRSIADEPDAIDVDLIERRGEVTLLVHADKGDMGPSVVRQQSPARAIALIVLRWVVGGVETSEL